MNKVKKVLFTAFVAVVGITSAYAGNDKVITVKQLPQNAQTMLRKYFKNVKPALVKQETEFFGKTYDVVLNNGFKLEFDKNGNWTEVDGSHKAVPAAVVPNAIRNYVKENYPSENVVKIERERGAYDVELSNDIELKFNKQFEVIDIDY